MKVLVQRLSARLGTVRASWTRPARLVSCRVGRRLVVNSVACRSAASSVRQLSVRRTTYTFVVPVCRTAYTSVIPVRRTRLRPCSLASLGSNTCV